MAMNQRAFDRLRIGVRISVFAAALLAAGVSPASAQEAERLNVSLQNRSGYGRMVLSFPDRLTLPAYQVNVDNNVLAITFDQPVVTFMPEITEVLGDYAAVVRLDPDRRGIRIGLKGPFRVNSIEAGEKLFVDVLPPDWQGLDPGLPVDVVAELASRAEHAAELAEQRRKAEIARLNAPRVELRVGRHPTFTRLRFDWSIDTDVVFDQADRTVTLRFEWPVEMGLYELRSDQPAEIAAMDAEIDGDGSTLTLELAEGVEARFFSVSERQYILDIDFADVPGRTVSLTELVDEPVAEPTEQAAAAEAAPESAGMAPSISRQTEITPFVNAIGSTVRVVFPFDQDTPAAVFRRAGVVWLLFDTHVGISAPAEGGALDDIASSFEVSAANQLQIVRMRVDEERLATLGSEGRAWVLSLGDILLAPTEPVTLERQRGETGRMRIVADMNRPAKAHEVHDPEVGDLLEVVTAYPPARGLIRTLDFVDFEAIQAVHGLVIKPKRTGVAVTIEGQLVAIDAPDGLTLSAPIQARPAEVEEDARARATFIDLAGLRRDNPRELVETRDELMRRAAQSEGQMRDGARLDLAQFLVANSLAQEALGVLDVLERQAEDNALEERIEITRSAADVLAGRAREALTILLQDRLADSIDAALWRVMARSDQEQWARAREDALIAEVTVGSYPQWVRNRFLFAAMLAAIETGDSDLAKRYAGRFDFDIMTAEERSRFDVLSGRIDEIEGRLDEAIDTYGKAIVAGFRPTQAEAVYRTLRVLDAQGRLDLERAAQTLHTQAMMWRGDELEARMQGFLGDLYFRSGQYRPGFEVLRQAAKVHADSAPVEALYDEARVVFADLFLNGKADALEPVEALGIFYDFRNLTPSGTGGDEMIRNLARRLVKIDLLEQAAGLLEYQIDFRLEGAARAQVATDLALINLADRRPDMALQALYRTRLANLSPSLERQRRILEARALIESGRDELALELLSSVEGRDSVLLQVDAYWAGGHYRRAGELLEGLCAEQPDSEPLTLSARTELVKAAVAYALEDDRIGLTRLRAKFSDRLAKTPEWALFDFVTSEAAPTTNRFRQIVREIAGVDSLNAFLAAYQQRYGGDAALLPMSARPADGA